MRCTLWGINRWLRYTGWRLAVLIDTDQTKTVAQGRAPTELSLEWYGWDFLRGK